MSREASIAWSWRHAFALSDLPATTKAVLHTVGMFMNEVGESCYPSVADLCRYSGLDKKTVLKHLAVASEAGWLAISQHGFRGQKWKRNQYAPRWPERDLISPCPPDDGEKGGVATPPPSSVDKAVESAPEGGGIGGSKVVEHVHQDKTSPENTPNTSPVEREREREEKGEETLSADAGQVTGEDTPGTAAFEKRVMRFCNGRGFMAGPWPDWDTSSPGWIAGRFAALSSEERLEAERWRDPYLLDLVARKKTPVPVGVFFKGKTWTGLDAGVLERAEKQRLARLPPDERARPEGWAKCLGPVGMARLFAELLDGQSKGLALSKPFVSDAELREAWPFLWRFRALLRQKGGAEFGPRWHALKTAMEPVPQGTETLAAWKSVFLERGWLWLAEFDRIDVVYCPAGGPAGLEAFEQAVRGKQR
ncbi:MAG: helix-turn-helix domain-containing protein [Mesorhizobium sp.]|nr:MAG: helix-turn-helix domain-containing protein [Mesorhizobium sp.]